MIESAFLHYFGPLLEVVLGVFISVSNKHWGNPSFRDLFVCFYYYSWGSLSSSLVLSFLLYKYCIFSN